MKITLTPTVADIMTDKAIDEKQTLERCVNTTLLEQARNPYKLALEAFEAKLHDIVFSVHSENNHEPEYAVVFCELQKVKKEFQI